MQLFVQWLFLQQREVLNGLFSENWKIRWPDCCALEKRKFDIDRVSMVRYGMNRTMVSGRSIEIFDANVDQVYTALQNMWQVYGDSFQNIRMLCRR